MQLIAQTCSKTNAYRQIPLMGVIIAAVWMIAYVIAFSSVELILPFTLKYGEGLIPLQLGSYSFIHLSFSHLVFDLFWLGILINIGKKYLSPADFIRLYSLGTIGGGWIWLSLFWLFREEEFIVGANLFILTMLGALAVLEQGRVSVFGVSRVLKLILIMGWLYLIVVPSLPGSSFSAGFFLGTLADGLILILALFRIRLMRLAVVWLLADLIIWLGWNFRPDIFLADAAALGIGMIYVLAEKWGRRVEAKTQSSLVSN